MAEKQSSQTQPAQPVSNALKPESSLKGKVILFVGAPKDEDFSIIYDYFRESPIMDGIEMRKATIEGGTYRGFVENTYPQQKNEPAGLIILVNSYKMKTIQGASTEEFLCQFFRRFERTRKDPIIVVTGESSLERIAALFDQNKIQNFTVTPYSNAEKYDLVKVAQSFLLDDPANPQTYTVDLSYYEKETSSGRSLDFKFKSDDKGNPSK